MPSWINTPVEEKAWKKAKGIVSRQRKKSEDKFSDRDFGLVAYITKNILKASAAEAATEFSVDEGMVFALANVEHLLERRRKKARRQVDASLPADTQDLLKAISQVAALGSESIAVLRSSRKRQPVEASLVADLHETAAKLQKLLASVKG